VRFSQPCGPLNMREPKDGALIRGCVTYSFACSRQSNLRTLFTMMPPSEWQRKIMGLSFASSSCQPVNNRMAGCRTCPTKTRSRATYISISVQLRYQRLSMLQDPIRTGRSPLEGRDSRVVSPRQHAGVTDILGQKVRMAQPADILLGAGCPCADGVAVQTVDGNDTAWERSRQIHRTLLTILIFVHSLNIRISLSRTIHLLNAKYLLQTFRFGYHCQAF
jgi:hypothetical protein